MRRARTLEAEVEQRTHELVGQNAIVEQQAERLAELAATKDRVLTRISHEFRTPLTSHSRTAAACARTDKRR